MVIFNSYFDITRGYPAHVILIVLNGSQTSQTSQTISPSLKDQATALKEWNGLDMLRPF